MQYPRPAAHGEICEGCDRRRERRMRTAYAILASQMRSSTVRVTLGAVALTAIGVAVFLIFRSEQRISQLTSSLRAFDQHARDAGDALAEARVAQHAYVAAGQGVAFWTNRLSAAAEQAEAALAALQRSAGPGARTALEEAAGTAIAFRNIDKRVRDYLASGEQFMAADVIFTEGGDAAATAGRQVETARNIEHQAFDVNVAAMRKQEATIIGSAAGLIVLVLLLLIPAPRRRAPASTAEADASVALSALIAAPAPPGSFRSSEPSSPSTASGMFKAAAGVATDFGRVRDLDELTLVLGRAADVLDASGLMVWMGSAPSGDLRPVLAHGYSADMVARIPPVPRSADNAAAAAYRSSRLQIVMCRPGVSTGAVVAPILSVNGCIGALSAEIRNGAETAESVQSIAAIFAAHLATVFATEPAVAEGATAANL